jgi:hypothetical protein
LYLRMRNTPTASPKRPTEQAQDQTQPTPISHPHRSPHASQRTKNQWDAASVSLPFRFTSQRTKPDPIGSTPSTGTKPTKPSQRLASARNRLAARRGGGGLGARPIPVNPRVRTPCGFRIPVSWRRCRCLTLNQKMGLGPLYAARGRVRAPASPGQSPAVPYPP